MTKPSFTTDQLRELMKIGKWEDGYDVIVNDFLTWVDRTVPDEPTVKRPITFETITWSCTACGTKDTATPCEHVHLL